jgi:uncharacterized membrane protein YeiH
MSLITLINWVGTLAFAISGALVGVKKRFDLLGVIILGAVTAVGGGATRDVIVGYIPLALQDEKLLWAVIMVSIICMAIPHWIYKFDRIWLYCDALGLALFSVLGARIACMAHLHFLGAVFLGALSGAGGGLMRDLLSNEIPSIMLPDEIYASAAAAGAATFYVLNAYFPNFALIGGAAVTFLIRVITKHFGWSLPSAKIVSFK